MKRRYSPPPGVFLGQELLLFWGGIAVSIFFVGGLMAAVFAVEGEWRNADVRRAHANMLEARVASAYAHKRAVPSVVKGLYMTSWSASDKKKRAALVDLVERTELNTIVIDIKDWDGTVMYASEVSFTREYGLASPRISDLQEFLRDLNERGIWTIARLPVFQDTVFAEARPALAITSKRTGGIWRDRKGLAWVDPASREAWQYTADLARDAFVLGFDEVQFDYIRFPSDGKLSDMSYPVWDGVTPKYEVIGNFFRYLRETLGERAVLSADLFGMTMLKVDYPDDDLGIGQRIADAVSYLDYISPMVYPSHYPPTFEGFINPAAHPYEVVAVSLREGAPAFEGQRAKMRPWLQDFDLGAVYTADMVRAQMRASDEAGAAGWMFWNASNNYTEEAYLPEAPTE